MEHAIGQEIEIIDNNKNIKLKVEESPADRCDNCFFLYKDCLRGYYSSLTSCCSSMSRTDKKNIIYRQIE